MSRDGVMPGVFRRVDPRTGNPWAATLVMSAINLGLLILALATDGIGHALGNIVSSLGLISILFYGLTGAAAVWQNRGALVRSPADFMMGGLLPGVGALFMAWVAVESVRSGATSGAILAYGIGSVALGAVVAVLLHGFGDSAFFRPRRHATFDETSVSREQPL
jgi:amino acid transporter